MSNDTPVKRNIPAGDASPFLRYPSILVNKLRHLYLLLVALLIVSFLICTYVLAWTTPEYTAVTTIGAPPSTLDQMTSLTSGGLGASLVQGLGRRLGSGGIGAAGTVFEEYQQLLTSNRVAAMLAADPNVMHAIFYKRYDWDRHVWILPGGDLAAAKNYLKGLIHYPIKTHPNTDDVVRYLAGSVTVDAPLTSNYVTVSLVAEDPKKAEWLLNTLLRDVDTLIRGDRRKVVTARIRYLVQIVPTITQADQRVALTAILSGEQQTMMAVEADNRYASTLVDPPHASLIPSSPKPLVILGQSVLLAFGLWCALVFLLPETHYLLVFFSRFSGVRTIRKKSGPH